MHVIGLWEEAGVLGDAPAGQWIQTTYCEVACWCNTYKLKGNFKTICFKGLFKVLLIWKLGGK